MNKLQFSIKLLLCLTMVSAYGANCLGDDVGMRITSVESADMEAKGFRVFKLENGTEKDIQFHGYSVDQPRYFIRTREDAQSPIVDQRMGWCGTGMGTHTVKRGKSVEFTVRIQKKFGQVQAGVNIIEKDKKPKVVWSTWVVIGK